MSRKYEALDLTKLYSLGSFRGWNDFLTECLDKGDINALAVLRYRIAAGMDDLAKAKLNTEDMCVFYIRLNRSIENTAKAIIRRKHPLPQDDPLNGSDSTRKTLEAKRKRDHELQMFMKKSAY